MLSLTNWFESNATLTKVNPLTLGLVQIDDAFSRLSTILRKAAEIKNCLVPINKLPSETVIHTATFFEKERDLVNATAVCQRWRTILLSFPPLWCNAGGSSSEVQAYIERSRPLPIVANLSSPEVAELVASHTDRLVGLAVRVDVLDQIAEYLPHPIPTLHTIRISAGTPGLRMGEVASSGLDGPFTHSKKLDFDGITFRTFHKLLVVPNTLKTFTHVTELTVHASDHAAIEIVYFLNTLEQLPALERISIAFANTGWYGCPQTITLPRAQEMNLFAPKLMDRFVPPILGYIKLPNLSLLRMQILLPALASPYPILPNTSFAEYLPNLTDLPELQAIVDKTSIEATFRNPQAVVSYVASDRFRTYHRDRVIWGALPLHTVRRLIVDVRDPCEDVDDGWFVEMLQGLPGLECVEFRGEFPTVVQRLCCRVVQGGFHVPIRTLVECAAGAYETQRIQL